MKALIWTGCILGSLVATIICDAILKPFGVRLGWLLRGLVFAAGVVLARFLCLKLCRKSFRKSVEKKLAKEGTTPAEYIKKKVPQKCLEMCEFYKGKTSELDAYLRTLVKDERIPKDAYAILMEMYGYE